MNNDFVVLKLLILNTILGEWCKYYIHIRKILVSLFFSFCIFFLQHNFIMNNLTILLNIFAII